MQPLIPLYHKTVAVSIPILCRMRKIIPRLCRMTGNMLSYPMTANTPTRQQKKLTQRQQEQKAALQELMDRYRDGKLTDEPFIAEQMKIVNANR